MTEDTQSQPRGLVLLGSTGSIGDSTLSVVDNLGPDRIRVIGLAAGQRVEKLAEQARKYKAEFVSCVEGEAFERLKQLLKDTDVKVLCGSEGQCQMVRSERCDTVLAAVTGAAGLPAVVETVRLGRRLCLSNKESLVMAGPLVRRLARANGAELLPVDSEHSALFQALQSGQNQEVKRLILTASGGPFRTWSKADMDKAGVEQALKHPTWKMGPNITIDSATMMNKSLELIEAQYLFDMEPERIDLIVHPQSVVHSLVEYVDGNVLAQLGVPDMRVPIQYALTYPERFELPTKAFNLAEIANLSFENMDREKFPAVNLAYQVMSHGGAAGAVFNAANEVARAAFLDERIAFGQIVSVTAQVLERFFHDSEYSDWSTASITTESEADPDSEGREELALLIAADRWAREEAKKCLQTLVS